MTMHLFLRPNQLGCLSKELGFFPYLNVVMDGCKALVTTELLKRKLILKLYMYFKNLSEIEFNFNDLKSEVRDLYGAIQHHSALPEGLHIMRELCLRKMPSRHPLPARAVQVSILQILKQGSVAQEPPTVESLGGFHRSSALSASQKQSHICLFESGVSHACGDLRAGGVLQNSQGEGYEQHSLNAVR